MIAAALIGAACTGLVAFVIGRFSKAIDRRDTLDEKTQGKIEQVDHTARESISRVERELTRQVSELTVSLATLSGTVTHLPTGEEMRSLTHRLAQVEREVTGAVATLDSNTEMVRTIRDHILESERK
jgi:hypothetical protein